MADTKKVFTHLQDLESANQSWFNKPSMKFDNYKDILPDLRKNADGSGDAYIGKFTNHPKFKERYKELGGDTRGLKSISKKKRNLMFDTLIDKPEIQGDTDWNTYFKSFNAKGDEIIEASGGPKLEGTDLFDIVGGGPDANTTPYEIDRTIALPVEFEYQEFNANEGITPKLDRVEIEPLPNNDYKAGIKDESFSDILLEKQYNRTDYKTSDSVINDLKIESQAESPALGKDNIFYADPQALLDQHESVFPSESVSQLDGSLMNKNTDLALAAYNADKNIGVNDEFYDENDVPKMSLVPEVLPSVASETPDKYEQMMAKFKEEMYPDMFIPSVSSEKVALSAEALSLQELREIETHVVTGPPNAAAVDFIKKEGYFQDENTSFESKLANDSNATVDNTYFPPTDSQGLETYDAVLSPEKIKGFQNYLDRLKIEDERKQNEELKRKKQNETISQQTADKNIIRKADDKAAVIARSEQSAKEHDQRVKDNIEKLSAEKRANDIAERTQKLSAANHERDVKERIKRLKSVEDAEKVRNNLNGGDTVTRAAAQQAKRDNSLAEQ